MICPTVFLAAVLALPAAAQDAILPPPGLYRVDTDATILAHGGNDPPVRVQRDGADGVTLTAAGARTAACTAAPIPRRRSPSTALRRTPRHRRCCR